MSLVWVGLIPLYCSIVLVHSNLFSPECSLGTSSLDRRLRGRSLRIRGLNIDWATTFAIATLYFYFLFN